MDKRTVLFKFSLLQSVNRIKFIDPARVKSSPKHINTEHGGRVLWQSEEEEMSKREHHPFLKREIRTLLCHIKDRIFDLQGISRQNSYLPNFLHAYAIFDISFDKIGENQVVK